MWCMQEEKAVVAVTSHADKDGVSFGRVAVLQRGAMRGGHRNTRRHAAGKNAARTTERKVSERWRRNELSVDVVEIVGTWVDVK